MVQSSPEDLIICLHVLVVINALQEHGKEDRVVEETAMTAAVAGAKTSHHNEALHACGLHGIDKDARGCREERCAFEDATIVRTEGATAAKAGAKAIVVRSTKTEYRLRQRARIVLLAADGIATRAIGRLAGCTTGTASKWRVRYAEQRLSGLDETGNRGNDPKYTGETDKRILAVLDGTAPKGYARWTGPLIAAALGDVDVQYVWRFLRAQNIDLCTRKSWCESNDPRLCAAKAAEIDGLYLNPPQNALVLAVDEKPSIQALERRQGYLKLANGRALLGLQTARDHDFVRGLRCRNRQSHGTAL
jgi:transposase